MTTPLLAINNLTTVFPGKKADLAAVDGLDLSMEQGEVLGLVGESGCGKSLTALSIMGLVPPPGRAASGEVCFRGEDLLKASPERLQELRGSEVGMIFQEPMTSLNPVFTIGRQVSEALLAHREKSKPKAWKLAVEALERVGIPDAPRRAESYPHQFSGGMRQRVMIAMALILSPALLIADEPTTALDVTIQAQILELLRELQEETRSAVLLISHNLAVVAQMASRVAVMYTGRIVEESSVGGLFSEPLHPYTRGLLSCLPARAPETGVALSTIPGMVPSLGALPPGCAFSDRCPQAFELCTQLEPALAEVAPGHRVRCYLHHRLGRERGRRSV